MVYWYIWIDFVIMLHYLVEATKLNHNDTYNMCLKYGVLINSQFVNALIKDIKLVVDFRINVPL